MYAIVSIISTQDKRVKKKKLTEKLFLLSISVLLLTRILFTKMTLN